MRRLVTSCFRWVYTVSAFEFGLNALFATMVMSKFIVYFKNLGEKGLNNVNVCMMHVYERQA